MANDNQQNPALITDSPAASSPYAVIDIGSTSIRMIIAEVFPDGKIHQLDFLYQTIPLGKDTFTTGVISKSNIDKCIKTLNHFHQILNEYGITPETHLRVVATTAVREAGNSDAFVDRISIATGFAVEIIEDIDIARLTYLSYRAHLAEYAFLCDSDIVVCEVSGGSTFLLYISKGDVHFAQSYRLGSLRTYEMIESTGTPEAYLAAMTKSHIKRTVENIIASSGLKHADQLVALGGDPRFAASQLLSDKAHKTPCYLDIPKLSTFTDKILSLKVDECIRRYKLSFADAETIGVGLLSYVELAKKLHVRKLLLTDISMRHGLLLEMYGTGIWSGHLREQIVRSVLEIGKRYQFDEDHAKQIGMLCMVIFNALKIEHKLEPWSEIILVVAAYLHDIGSYIDSRKHHKHSQYIIQNSPIFGCNRKEVLIAGLVARYHRRSTPKPVHIDFMALERKDRILVTKLAAILRVADALDRANNQHIQKIDCHAEEGQFIITVSTRADIMLEQISLQEKGVLFSEVYGMNVVLRKNLKDM